MLLTIIPNKSIMCTATAPYTKYQHNFQYTNPTSTQWHRSSAATTPCALLFVTFKCVGHYHLSTLRIDLVIGLSDYIVALCPLCCRHYLMQYRHTHTRTRYLKKKLTKTLAAAIHGYHLTTMNLINLHAEESKIHIDKVIVSKGQNAMSHTHTHTHISTEAYQVKWSTAVISFTHNRRKKKTKLKFSK